MSNEPTFVKSLFTIDDEKKFEGFHNPTVHWNGWAKPLMTKRQARPFMEYFNALPLEEVDHFEFVEGREKGIQAIKVMRFEEEPYTIEAETIMVGRRSKLVYDVSLGYIWDEVTTD